MEMTGAEIVVQSLIEEGVEHLFGYPGGAVLNIYDAIHQQDELQHILVRHEQAATHAADGYARSTGKPGVILVTSGPGATNAVTGIATAYMDSIPMVVLTGQVPLHLIGNDAFQEVDSVGITRPVVKHNFLVEDIKDLASTIKKAFYVATTGRPGPVVVDIPKDITGQKAEFSYPRNISIRSYQPNISIESAQVKRAYELILEAKKPMIYTGGGVILSNASEELIKFTQLLGAPITNTLMGLGAYPANEKQFVGMLGMHGTYEANMSMHNCDVLIAIGARFDDRVTGNLEKFCPDARIVHVDIDPASISKNVKVDVAIVGDVKEVVVELNKLIEASDQRLESAAMSSWWQQIEEWRAQDCLKFNRETGTIKPQFVVEQLHEVTKGNAFVTSDVGQHQMFAAQYYGFNKPRRWINSGGLGTMGFGLPAAMGVQLAHPDEQVACITGEGSIQMCIQELATCTQYGLPVKIINLNNGFLGMVRQWQEFFYEKRYASSYMES
ncbi:MAG TPA: biosynthetic-type acetolactate synthase large subunit, partial [Gammaproteobacteria bacterium]|nr:biosynthetic-type acetolactate synthase large subunit [Gammaproteobacteria bacterium]